MEFDPKDTVANLILKAEKYIYDELLDANGKPTYPQNRDGSEFYLKFFGEDIILQSKDVLRYAKDSEGNQKYPKDKYGNDKCIPSLYATTKDGDPFYPKKSNNDEFYLKYNDEDMIIDAYGELKYARDASENDIYPIDAHGNDKYIDSIYAITNTGLIIFPKTKDYDEFYLKNSDGSSIIIQDDIPLPRYAKRKNGDEIYPTQYYKPSQSVREVVLMNQYAKLSNQQIFYPLDAYGNEYTMTFWLDEPDPWGQIFINVPASYPNSYPITNDNFVIVPNLENSPYFLWPPEVVRENILGKLYRDTNGYHDYLTNVMATRTSRSTPKQYIYFSMKEKTPVKRVPASLKEKSLNWLFTLLWVIVLTLIVSLQLLIIHIYFR